MPGVCQLVKWIVDSGATSHMCKDKELFTELHSLKKSTEVLLGDGHVLTAPVGGTALLDFCLPNGKTQWCKLHNVLYVPSLSYKLLSVSKVAQSEKVTKFSKLPNCKLIARATKVGSFYHLDCETSPKLANVGGKVAKEEFSIEDLATNIFESLQRTSCWMDVTVTWQKKSNLWRVWKENITGECFQLTS